MNRITVTGRCDNIKTLVSTWIGVFGLNVRMAESITSEREVLRFPSCVVVTALFDDDCIATTILPGGDNWISRFGVGIVRETAWGR